ncbi:hypothetical protein FRC00_005193, partial [Tulasnella sp. 408]
VPEETKSNIRARVKYDALQGLQFGYDIRISGRCDVKGLAYPANAETTFLPLDDLRLVKGRANEK